MTNRIESEVRGPGLISPAARLEYRALVPGQSLLLEREPGNAVDPHAVIVKTQDGQPCGYLAKEDAQKIAGDIDRGARWSAKVLSVARAMQYPRILLTKKRS